MQILKRYRFCRHDIHAIVDLLRVWLERPTVRRQSLSSLEQVLVALRFYRTGSFQIVLGDAGSISQPSVFLCSSIPTKNTQNMNYTVTIISLITALSHMRSYHKTMTAITEADRKKITVGWSRLRLKHQMLRFTTKDRDPSSYVKLFQEICMHHLPYSSCKKSAVMTHVAHSIAILESKMTEQVQGPSLETDECENFIRILRWHTLCCVWSMKW